MNTATALCLKREEVEVPIICSWCNKIMGTKEIVKIGNEPEPTHGICPECREKHFPEADAAQAEPSIHMNMLCYENGDLVAIQGTDELSNLQLKACMDFQRRVGRDIVFELVW